MKCILCAGDRHAVYQRRDGDSIFKCLNCGLLFVFPQPTGEELRQYYKDFKPDYLLKYQTEVIRKGKEILKIVHRFKKPGRLLDLGCGYGFFMDLARKKGWEVFGIELSPFASEFARSNFGLGVFTGQLSEANLRENYYDFISLQHILEHLPEPLKDLAVIKSKLKDDGLLLVIVPNVLSLISKCVKGNWLCLCEKTHLFHYSKATLVKLLEKSGFCPIIVKTFEWDTQRVLWAIKSLIFRQHKSSQTTLSATQEAACFSLPEKQNGTLKSLIIKTASPFSRLIAKLGLGAEIAVIARKRCGQ